MRLKLCFLTLFFQQFLFSQEISGSVSKADNIPIENANVSIWSSEHKETLLSYEYTNEKGFYSFKIKPEYKIVFIEVSALDFATTSKSVTTSVPSQKIDFTLEIKEIELKEVIVKDEKAIRVKNDTTFYDPKKFLNGSERKVEDLIKKLPGMSVNKSTGEIKYKGKSVETVKLEDDDLFGGNYSIGTKNISVDMVEQVQAIENYSENPLLKGITDSDKVAINLKLKKQKTAYSGASSLSNGYGDKIIFRDDVSLLGISKTFKSFGIASYDNFGGGITDFNTFSQGFNSSEIPENNFYTKKILSELNESSSLPNYRTKFNNSVFANYNIIYKLSKKINIKNNFVYFYNDSYAYENFKNNYFLINNSNFETSQENYFTKKANSFKTDLKLTHKLNTKSLLISSLSFSKQFLSSNLNTIQNKTNLFQNNLQTDDLFFKVKTNYTLRISDKKALQFLSEFSKNDIPQQLLITPNNNFISNNFATNSFQNSNFSKQFFNNKITYLENRNNIKQTFSIGFISEINPFTSNLKENNSIINEFKNDLNYSKSNLICEYSTIFKWNKVKFQPYFSSNFYSQDLFNSTNFERLKKLDLVYNGNILMTFRVDKYSDVFLNGNFDNKTPDEEFMFTNKILENNTSLKSNTTSLDFLTSQSVNFGYKYYNLFKQFGFDLSFQFQKKQNNFISNISVNPNFTSINYFQSPVNLESKNLSLNIEKQIRSLRLYVKQNNTFSVNNYKNAIEDYKLRDNISRTLNISTLLFSNFNFLVNFENTFNYDLSNFKSNNEFQNQRIALNNVFKLIGKPINNWILTISQDYFVTDTKTNNHFNFFDFDIKYKSPKLKWLSINFTGKNMTDIKSFSETNNSDFSSSIYTSNLLPRNFLISTNLSF